MKRTSLLPSLLTFCLMAGSVQAQRHVRTTAVETIRPAGSLEAAHQKQPDARPTAGGPHKTQRPSNMDLFRGGPPVNDDCSGAIQLIPGVTCVAITGNTQGATQSIPAITCNSFTGDANDDVWFSFVATATGHTVLVTGSPDFDAVVDVRSGACSGTNIGCADATVEGETEQVVLGGLTVGATYFIRVYDYYAGTAPTTTFTICVTGVAPAPPNDLCTNVTPQALAVGGSLTFNGTTSGATATLDAVPGSDMDDGIPKVWHAFTLSTCAVVTFNLCGTTPEFGQAYIVVTACPASTYTLGTFDFTTCSDGNITVTLPSLQAGTYYIPVGLFGATSTGPYTLNVSAAACVSGPANDDCPGATPLAVNSICSPITADVAGATQSVPAITCNTFLGNAGDDVWFSFVASAPALTIEVTGSANFDAVVDLREGACNGATIACADATVGGETEVINANGLTVGETYYVRVYDYGTAQPLTTTFTICVYLPGLPPANDLCASITPQPLPVGGSLTLTGTTVGATTTNDAVPGSPMDDGVPKVWHAFTLTECADVTVAYCGTNPAFDNVYIVVTDCPADGFTPGPYNDTDCADGNFTVLFPALPAGTYYLPVGQFDVGTTGSYTIDLSAVACAGPPSNDDCANAIPVPVNAPTDCPANAVTGNNSQAAITTDDPDCDSSTDGYQDVWYTFNSLANTEITIDLAPGTATDLFIELLDACGGNTIFCDIIAPPYVIPVTPNTQYTIRVFSNLEFGSGGQFTICVSGTFSTSIAGEQGTHLTLFPNPAEGWVNVWSEQAANGAELRIIDMSGRVVHGTSLNLAPNAHTTIQLPSNLASGSYTMQLIHDGRTRTAMLMKQ